MKPASWQTHRSEADAPAGADAFINRELSNLSFIERVLDEGEDESVSLTERVRFVALANTALDEFFMIRVAGLKRQLASGVDERGPDGLDAQQQLAAIGRRCRDIGRRQDSAVMDRLLPLLEQAGVRFEPRVGASAEAVAAAIEHCVREVLPVLTPIVLDPGHPFPHLRNKSLNLLVAFSVGRLRYGVVPVPSLLSRIVRVPQGMFLLEDAIALCVARLFPDVPIAGCWAFRVTRNWDLNVDEEKGEDLLLTIEREVRRRDRGSAVRLQLDARAGEDAGSFLRGALALEQQDVYPQRRPLALTDFLASVLAQEELKGRVEPAPAPASTCSPATRGPNSGRSCSSRRLGSSRRSWRSSTTRRRLASAGASRRR
jgi:polyphosphate kinase